MGFMNMKGGSQEFSDFPRISWKPRISKNFFEKPRISPEFFEKPRNSWLSKKNSDFKCVDIDL